MESNLTGIKSFSTSSCMMAKMQHMTASNGTIYVLFLEFDRKGKICCLPK